ncbi:uncharacterized protein LAESUDRAFT_341679 [Laetiporus sulphureus 93-53]|uniref:Glycopeptide n=1 Tax=Laetiporus sulphureus 93-53 TaxID=1314785 RepID=A0A165GPG3_9APHY|nr:uncharacterized protein LAESUDRAFT_341679 [Laetiporus sulphureus 93-53]KZT10627.1 hypothetical protein LAESUDRAFT_341679 [Laetiporus sulphureus 93-53]
MYTLFSAAALAVTLLATSGVKAETHSVMFDNQCGYGYPQLIQGGTLLSNGSVYTGEGAISSVIAYLQTGDCGWNGENCALVELTLTNPTAPGTGSSADISLIAPHTYNVQTSFSYYDGCANTGANCASSDCTDAFYNSDDNQVQVACEDNLLSLPPLLLSLLQQLCPALRSSALLPSPSSHRPYRPLRSLLRSLL